MIKSVKQRRRGSLLAIILFSALIAIIAVGTLTVATTLYTSNEKSMHIYGNLQSYRAATELSCYQYLNDLEAITVTDDIDANWVSVTESAVYTEAIRLITDAVSTEEGSLTWRTTDAVSAIGGTPVSDSSIMVKLIGLLQSGSTKFKLYMTEYPSLDWLSDSAEFEIGDMSIPLNPVPVSIDLSVKGESLSEELYIYGLYLHVITEERLMESGRYDTFVTVSIEEGEDNFGIYRQ